jgi:hypothetical protein
LRVRGGPENHLVEIRRGLARGHYSDMQTLRDRDQTGRIRECLCLIQVRARGLRQWLTKTKEGL